MWEASWGGYADEGVLRGMQEGEETSLLQQGMSEGGELIWSFVARN